MADTDYPIITSFGVSQPVFSFSQYQYVSGHHRYLHPITDSHVGTGIVIHRCFDVSKKDDLLQQ